MKTQTSHRASTFRSASLRDIVAALAIFASAPLAGHAQARAQQTPTQQARGPQTRNVILVTLDGFRWQELFTGADSTLIRTSRMLDDTTGLTTRYWRPTAEARREVLMPFVWSTIRSHGQIYGDRSIGSFVNVTNAHRFSYPGYSEILTGFADPRIDSNDKTPNPNRTVLEILNAMPAFHDRVAAFGSWDVFPYIINRHRSGIPVNAGFDTATGKNLTPRETWLNRMERQTPSPWSTVRLDAFTHNYALEYLKRARPRMLYIAYGETDDFAHNRKYDFYLAGAGRADAFIRELWTWVQSDAQYANHTTIIITTDHGRGFGDKWMDHGADVEGADAIWIAAIGPDTPHIDVSALKGQWYQNQVASTVAELLGVKYVNDRTVGVALDRVIGKR